MVGLEGMVKKPHLPPGGNGANLRISAGRAPHVSRRSAHQRRRRPRRCFPAASPPRVMAPVLALRLAAGGSGATG
jgi:hypothetical protein